MEDLIFFTGEGVFLDKTEERRRAYGGKTGTHFNPFEKTGLRGAEIVTIR